jgi:hypothetical protein
MYSLEVIYFLLTGKVLYFFTFKTSGLLGCVNFKILQNFQRHYAPIEPRCLLPVDTASRA